MFTRFLRPLFFVQLLVSSSALAEPENFVVSLENIQLGTFSIDHTIADNKYDSTVDFHLTGLARILNDFSVKGHAQGQGRPYLAYAPQESTVEINGNDTKRSYRLGYENGALTQYEADPAETSDIDPATQSDAVDPVTAATYLFRRVSLERVCAMRVPIFDGQRVAHLILQRPTKRPDGRMECRGFIEPIYGYDENSLLQKAPLFFNVIIRYLENDEYGIDRIIGKSALGGFSIVRQ